MECTPLDAAQEIPRNLAEGHLIRDQAESAFIDAAREVSTLEAVLAIPSRTALTPPCPTRLVAIATRRSARATDRHRDVRP